MALELPAVAKSVYTSCKKCNAERYHVVIAHKTATSAKVKCEVCGSQKTYSLPKLKSPNAKPRVSRKAPSESVRRSQHQAEYEGLLQQHEATATQNYSLKGKFEVNQKLQHPKFGLGLIRTVQPDKIEVVFADEVRQLVHNRT